MEEEEDDLIIAQEYEAAIILQLHILTMLMVHKTWFENMLYTSR